MLCAPAVVVMLAVTGYPILYALWLSLHKFDLRFPSANHWVGFNNYGEVLSSSTWWGDVLNTAIITVSSVAIELVLGMLIALVMHRAIFGRGPVRAAILIPYGIVTVVAAFAQRKFLVRNRVRWISGLGTRRQRSTNAPSSTSPAVRTVAKRALPQPVESVSTTA